MRRHLGALALVGSLAVLAPGAQADRNLKTLTLDPAVAERMLVLHDGSRHYVVIEKKAKSEHFYYGDGKRFFAQLVLGTNRVRKSTFARSFWSPTFQRNGTLLEKNGAWSITCDQKTEIPLQLAPAKDARRMIARGKFYPRRFQRQVQFFGRDEEANYYVVDSERQPHRWGDSTPELRDLRLFRGPAGQMKRLRATQIASDAEGLVMVTKAGTLLIERGMRSNQPGRSVKERAVWKGKKERLQLKLLEKIRNRALLYGGLGIYGRLGTPCDDMVAP